MVLQCVCLGVLSTYFCPAQTCHAGAMCICVCVCVFVCIYVFVWLCLCVYVMLSIKGVDHTFQA